MLYFLVRQINGFNPEGLPQNFPDNAVLRLEKNQAMSWMVK